MIYFGLLSPWVSLDVVDVKYRYRSRYLVLRALPTYLTNSAFFSRWCRRLVLDYLRYLPRVAEQMPCEGTADGTDGTDETDGTDGWTDGRKAYVEPCALYEVRSRDMYVVYRDR